MDPDREMGLVLSLEDCKCLFRTLKREESSLSDQERVILQRMERVLYSRLSIKEIEDLSG